MERLQLDVTPVEVSKPNRLKFKLTKTNIDGLQLTQKGQRIYWDSQLPGFGVVIGKTAKSYVVQHDINGRAVRVTIGKHGVFTPDEARQEARRLLNEMALGRNPVEEKRKRKQENKTLGEVWELFEKTRKLKPNTLHDYTQLMDRVFKEWKKKPIKSITRDMVAARHRNWTEESGASYSNYAFRVLSVVVNFGMGRFPDIITTNPVQVLSRTKAWNPQRRRENVIADSQLSVWFRSLDDLRTKADRPPVVDVGCDYLEFVLLTGLRRNEAARLTWDRVDLENKTLRIDDTKNECALVLPLTAPLLTILERRKGVAEMLGSKFVFPSPGRNDICLKEPKCIADRVRTASGITFTIHDLRRTFITVAYRLQIPHYTLKRLVNHKMGGDVTAGYIHGTVEDLRGPMQKLTDYFLAKKAESRNLKIATAS